MAAAMAEASAVADAHFPRLGSDGPGLLPGAARAAAVPRRRTGGPGDFDFARQKVP